MKNDTASPRLRSIELQLLPLFDIVNVRARIRLAHIGCTLQTHQKYFSITTAALAAAAREARSSRTLKDFMTAAMQLRDYVQRGPDALTTTGAPPRVMDI